MRPTHWLYTVPLRIRSLFHRDAVEHELGDELQYHLEQKTREFLVAGFSPEEARRRAAREFGGLELTKENCRDARRVNFLEDLLHDLAFGLRMFRNNPALL
jgi:putative ABC transport system permease protein